MPASAGPLCASPRRLRRLGPTGHQPRRGGARMAGAVLSTVRWATRARRCSTPPQPPRAPPSRPSRSAAAAGGGALGRPPPFFRGCGGRGSLASAVAGFAQGAAASAIAAGAIGAHVDSERDLRQLSRSFRQYPLNTVALGACNASPVSLTELPQYSCFCPEEFHERSEMVVAVEIMSMHPMILRGGLTIGRCLIMESVKAFTTAEPKSSTVISKELVEAPQDLIQEAVLFHPFAEACIPHCFPKICQCGPPRSFEKVVLASSDQFVPSTEECRSLHPFHTMDMRELLNQLESCTQCLRDSLYTKVNKKTCIFSFACRACYIDVFLLHCLV
ncbi:hypothetical protein HU200_011336 [Digitaria exilis]|uniref:Uncharacterized protein n=1 Tax=Digitaria exilis TaxID=1010633 RepID=A0A835FGT4_9POAL|nr:hypothetical protein HU200_011336 [Digitaria exilis]